MEGLVLGWHQAEASHQQAQGLGLCTLVWRGRLLLSANRLSSPCGDAGPVWTTYPLTQKSRVTNLRYNVGNSFKLTQDKTCMGRTKHNYRPDLGQGLQG